MPNRAYFSEDNVSRPDFASANRLEFFFSYKLQVLYNKLERRHVLSPNDRNITNVRIVLLDANSGAERAIDNRSLFRY